jgi:GxxExxY protein
MVRAATCGIDEREDDVFRARHVRCYAAAMIHSAELLNEITSRIIAAAIEIHRTLGPGLLEGAYSACLAHELHERGMPFELQKVVPLVYKSVRLDAAYRADMIVDRAVLVEVKALDAVAPVHSRQLQTYLRLTDLRVGLLLNFGAPVMRAGIKRIVNRFPEQ